MERTRPRRTRKGVDGVHSAGQLPPIWSFSPPNRVHIRWLFRRKLLVPTRDTVTLGAALPYLLPGDYFSDEHERIALTRNGTADTVLIATADLESLE